MPIFISCMKCRTRVLEKGKIYCWACLELYSSQDPNQEYPEPKKED